jgi:phosphatidylinositol alpha 1,6-mannosyltransferase
MPTLAFLVTGFPPDVSGVSHINWERAQWLAQRGDRVIVFAPDWQQVPSEELSKNLLIERYPSKPWLPYPLTHVPRFAAARWIRARLQHHQPDLIVVTDMERFFLLSCWQLPGRRYARQQGIPYIAEYHTDYYNFAATYPNWIWLREVVRSLKIPKALYRQADLTLCPSQAALESCAQLEIPRAQVLPFVGVPVGEYSPQLRDRTCLKSWLSPEEQDHQVILFLGRLALEKRVDLLIDAFQQLQQHYPKTSLILAGDGPAASIQALKRQTQAIPHVHFTGFVLGQTKAQLLASCDVFCSPSPYETFGRTVIEAMASGIPTISVDSGAVSEYLQQGVNSLIVPPNDAAALATAIATVLTQDCSTLVHNALKTAAEHSIESGFTHLRSYYDQLLADRHSPALAAPINAAVKN